MISGQSTKTPWSEEDRLAALYRYGILETPRETGFDDIVTLVAQILEVPIAAINLIDRRRQWFKAEIGLGVSEMPLDDSICKVAILHSGGMVIPDLAKDERFACSPLVNGNSGLRFYAGELLKTSDGFPLGTLCVLDTKPRPEGLTEPQHFALKALARQLMVQMELRLALQEQNTLLEQQKATQLELEIKEQKALEAMRLVALESSKLDALLEAAPVAITYTDVNGKSIKANAGSRLLWGEHPLPESIEEYSEWKAWWADGTERHGQRLQSNEWAVVRALAGENVSGDMVDIEPFGMPGIRRRIVLRASPVRGENEKIIGAVAVQMDITNQTTIEAALRQSEARFQAMTNAAPNIVFSALPDGRNDYFNEQLYEFTGLTFVELEGTGWERLIHPDDSHRTLSKWQESLRTGEPFENEFRLRHHSGEYRWILSRARPMQDARGQISRWMGTGTDIHIIRQTENALRDARRRLEAAVVAADMGTWTCDIATGRVYADGNFARFYGIPEENSQGGAISDYFNAIHPDDIERVKKRIALSSDNGNGFIDTYRVRQADGSYSHIQVRGKVDKDDAGRPTWLAGVALDVTVQKKAEIALARSEHKFRQLAQSNIVGIIQYRLDDTLTEANDAFLTMLGYTREEFEHHELRWTKFTPTGWQSKRQEAIAQLREIGTVPPHEMEYLRKDGTPISVLVGAANFAGSQDEGIAYVMDISVIRKTERALRESEAKFRIITNAMRQMVWAMQPGAETDYFNDRVIEFTGQSKEALTGPGWANFIHPDDLPDAYTQWQKALATGESFESEYRLRHHSGEYRWLLGRALPVQREDGTSHWMGTFTDIHDQKKIAEQLQLANERKDEFLAMLAHELRNPLAPIANAVQLLRFSAKDNKRAQEVVNIIERQVNHMTELVNDLLDVSRITRGLVELHMTVVDVKVVIAQAIEQVRPLIEAKGHTLQTTICAQHFFVIGDQTRLIQALSNILTNAAKYTPNGGHIKLEFMESATEATISIQDNGAGIEQSLLPYIFDLFTQAKRTPDRTQGGLGLGLTLVKRIAELHNGNVTAESLGRGKGSTFTLSLPLAHGNDASQEAREQNAVMLAGHNSRRILLVDDNTDAAQSLAMLLEGYGHSVRVENNGLKGLEAALTYLPEIAILDIGLPDIDGYELARCLRREKDTKSIILLALTGYGQDQDRELARAAGFNYHLVKPINFLELRNLIER